MFVATQTVAHKVNKANEMLTIFLGFFRSTKVARNIATKAVSPETKELKGI
jgi:hypothetical protein